MKMKTVITSITLAMLPLVAFSQPGAQPPTPPAPPAPPGQPGLPGSREDKMPKVPVTYLGVETSEVPSVLCDQLGLPKGFGLVVDYIVPDGPAAAAGVQQNDIIKMLNDQILTDPGQLSKLVRSFQDGTTVTLTLLRKGQEQKVSVKLAKKEVPRRHADMRNMGYNWNFDFGDAPDLGAMKEHLSNLKEQLSAMKEQMGEENRGMIHDAVVRAREQAERAREQAQRAAEQIRENAQRIRTFSRNNGAMEQTTIDLKNAQIVVSDDKGEMRIENKDGKKMLTAKDPQGKLLFSGPIESKEDVDKLPPEVRQRYDKLQQHDLPAVSPDELRVENDADDDEDVDADSEDEDDSSSRASTISYDRVSSDQFGHRTWEIHTVLI